MINLGKAIPKSVNVELRPPCIEDAAALAELANDEAVSAMLRDYFPHPYSVDDALRFIDTVGEKSGPRTDWFIYADDAVAGVMGLFRGEDVYRCNAEIGYWVGKRYWNQGIATAAIGEAVSYAFENLDVDRVYAEVFSINPGSYRVLQKCGFTEEYRLDDVVIKHQQRCGVISMGIRRQRPSTEKHGEPWFCRKAKEY